MVELEDDLIGLKNLMMPWVKAPSCVTTQFFSLCHSIAFQFELSCIVVRSTKSTRVFTPRSLRRSYFRHIFVSIILGDHRLGSDRGGTD